jgi:predicted SAM-dependent methyltransferase
MKLNIGCGYNHLKNYINIDSNRESLADKIMPAHSLDIKSESVSEIKALHLIEHLGFFRTKYFLSEAFRTLQSGGALIIETPHLEKSFENFSKGNKSERENILGWIYGSESEGMSHVYCFPIELMEEIADEAGFKITQKQYLNYYPNRPAIRYTLKKSAGLKYKSLMAEFRKKNIKKNIIDFNDEYIMHENENILKAIEKHLVVMNYNLILKLSLNNSDLIHEFFKFTAEEDKTLKKYLKIAKYLSGRGFDCLMYEYLMGQEIKEDNQKKVFDNTVGFGSKIVDDLLSDFKLKLKSAKGKDFKVFSFNMAKEYSQRYFKKGLKEFNLDNFTKAEKYLNKAIRLDRDNKTCIKSLLELKKRQDT